jgi:hypothetical protein
VLWFRLLDRCLGPLRALKRPPGGVPIKSGEGRGGGKDVSAIAQGVGGASSTVQQQQEKGKTVHLDHLRVPNNMA